MLGDTVLGHTVLADDDDAPRSVYATATVSGAMTLSASAQKVMNAVVNVPMVIYTPFINPDTLTLEYEETGVDLEASGSEQSNQTAHAVISAILSARRYVLRADAIAAVADVTLTATGRADINIVGECNVPVSFILAAVADVSNATASVELAVTVEAMCSLVSNVSASVEAPFDISFTAVLDTPCTTSEYSPFVGGGTGDAPAIDLPAASGDTGVKLMYPVVSPTDTIELTGPNFNSPHRFNMNRINRESRGGTLIIHADPDWAKVTELAFTFSNMSENQASELQRFMQDHLGKEIKLIDHEDRAWRGIITEPDDPVVQDGRGCQYTGSFKFEGERM